MPVDPNVLTQVKDIVAALVERPADQVHAGDLLIEDLELDSLQITELAQKVENRTGTPIDEDVLNARGITVERCAELASAP
ncbi:hypothetical protein GCM10010361_29250 [Streptomyces olivaceiscleroticus]|uniref:Carrier domain-containing protein n=1 Tax=Streptomyces olivaceiscleroticus TaxID=68245 RepID=A0ABP3JT20_9ACTN